MTLPEFQPMRKRVTAAEMKRAGVTANEQTQYGWLYPGGLLSNRGTGGTTNGWACFYLLVEGREYFTDDLDKLELILHERTAVGMQLQQQMQIHKGEKTSAPEPGNAGTSTQPKSIRMEEIHATQIRHGVQTHLAAC